MLIEIKGVQLVNKGAALMLRAVLERLRAGLPDARIALVPGADLPFRRIAELGAWQKLVLRWGSVDLDGLASHLPAKPREVLKRYGLVTADEIDAVIDASGFAYGRVWGEHSLHIATIELQRLGTRARPYVFLPQAFGPFDDSVTTRRFGGALRGAALICARDEPSRQHLLALDGALEPRIEVVPDFTIGLAGDAQAAQACGVDRSQVLLIPNEQMTGPRNPDLAWRSGYLEVLVGLARHARAHGLTPRVLNHEGPRDAALCAELSAAIGAGEVLGTDDPLAIKGIIGAAGLVISSRYHGCVSALSQGVPCIGTAWSHKYAALFGDFAVPQLLLTRPDVGAGAAILDDLGARSDAIGNTLATARLRLIERVEAMWTRVLDILRDARR